MYFVTMLSHLPKEKPIFMPRTFYKRTVGYFSDLEVAKDCLKQNMADVYEMDYPYAIIEKVNEGFYPTPEVISFYKYDEENNKYDELGDLGFVYTLFSF